MAAIWSLKEDKRNLMIKELQSPDIAKSKGTGH